MNFQYRFSATDLLGARCRFNLIKPNVPALVKITDHYFCGFRQPFISFQALFHKTTACISILLITTMNLFGQQFKCGTDAIISRQMNGIGTAPASTDNPGNNACTLPLNGAYTIPIVVHIMYNSPQGNITDAQVLDAVDKLNIDFLATDGVGFNTQIHFALANVDPNGNCTNGINRVEIPAPFGDATSSANDLALKNNIRWPNDRYLNIWVVECIFFGGDCDPAGGYSYLPCPVNVTVVPPPFPVYCQIAGQSPFWLDPYDGVVIAHPEFGRIGTAQNSFRAGVLAHEVGHWLNFYHTFSPNGIFLAPGNMWLACHSQSEGAIQGDFVEDTPATEGLQTGGGYDCTTITNSCPFPPDVDLIDNFMDYVGECHNSFTEGQSTRMKTCLTENRPDIWCEDNLVATGLLNYLPSSVNLTTGVDAFCANNVGYTGFEICLLDQGNYAFNVLLEMDLQSLPSYLTISGGSFVNGQYLLPAKLTPGGTCGAGNIVFQIGSILLAAQEQVTIPVKVTVFDDCGNQVEFFESMSFTIINCTFDCACTGQNQINIEADPINGTLWSDIAGQFNLPDDLGYSVHNGCIAVSGKLIIDRDVRITQCGSMYMQPGAEIVVGDINNPGAFSRLRLNGNGILSCEKMWKGISVKPGARIEANNNYIYNAQYVVRAENQATVILTSNTLGRNYVGIYVPGNNGTPQTVHFQSISDNTVECLDELLPGYDDQSPAPGQYTHAAIELNDVTGVDIQSGNVFQKIGNGIIALRSAFTIDHCVFKNLYANTDGGIDRFGIHATDCANAKITNCTFDQVADGIYAVNTNLESTDNVITTFDMIVDDHDNAGILYKNGTNRRIRIFDNQIKTALKGISINNCWPATGLRLYDNQIEFLPAGDNFPTQGIYLNTCLKGWVRRNEIRKGDDASGTGDGLFFENCQALNIFSNDVFDKQNQVFVKGCHRNFFLGNELTNGISGFNALNSTDRYCHNETIVQNTSGFYFQGACTPSRITCNLLGDPTPSSSNSGNGLSLWADGSMSTLIGTQINQGNQWYGAYPNGWGAYNQSVDPDAIDKSAFVSPPIQIPTWSTGVGQNVAWFKPFIGDPLNCVTACPVLLDPEEDEGISGEGGGEEQGLLGSDDAATARGEHAGTGINWMAQQRLYERLKADANLATLDNDVQSFFTQAPATDLGQLYEVRSQINELLQRDEITAAQTDSLQRAIKQLGDTLQALLLNGPDTDSLQWQNELDGLYTELTSLTDAYYALETWVHTQRQSETSNILAANELIIPSNSCAANEKTFNRLFLQNALWESGTPPATAIAGLKSIADQCPIDGGFAVYAARGFYQRFNPLAYWDDLSDCGGGSERSAFQKNAGDRALIFRPNPSNDLTMISAPSTLESDVRIYLYGPTGIKVHELTIRKEQASAFLNTAAFPPGVYVYKALMQGEVVQTGKLVIIH